jgi:hypothetical protein
MHRLFCNGKIWKKWRLMQCHLQLHYWTIREVIYTLEDFPQTWTFCGVLSIHDARGQNPVTISIPAAEVRSRPATALPGQAVGSVRYWPSIAILFSSSAGQDAMLGRFSSAFGLCGVYRTLTTLQTNTNALFWHGAAEQPLPEHVLAPWQLVSFFPARQTSSLDHTFLGEK